MWGGVVINKPCFSPSNSAGLFPPVSGRPELRGSRCSGGTDGVSHMQSHLTVVTGGTVLSNCTPLYLLLCIIGALFVSRLYFVPLLAVCAFTCARAHHAEVCAEAFWQPRILKLRVAVSMECTKQIVVHCVAIIS